jgi:predicted nucleic acid-binding protein
VILVDTGVLVALVNAEDENHEACQDWFLNRWHQKIYQHSGSTVEAAFLSDLAEVSRCLLGIVLSAPRRHLFDINWFARVHAQQRGQTSMAK